MRYVCSALALLLTLAAQAQTDSVRTEYKTEDEKISASDVKRFIRYITRADVEEKTLVKLGVWPNTDRSTTFDNRTFWVGADIDVSVEQKLTPALSVLVGIDGYASYTSYRIVRNATPIPSIPNPNSGIYYAPQQLVGVELSGKIGLRYYHNMAKKIRKGLSANNFSGNYIAAQVAERFRRYSSAKFYNVLTEERIGYPFYGENLLGNPEPRVSVAYGIQRRLGKRGYFDVNAGPEILFTGGFGTRNSFQLNALVGFGW